MGIANYTSQRDAANNEEIRTRGIRDASKDKLDRASAHHSQMTADENAAKLHEAKMKAIREQKQKEHNAQLAVLEKAKETNRTEQLRLNKERKLFEKVKGLLNGVKAEGRRLLDAEADIAPILAMLSTGTNADPAQVEEANKLLNELIAEGEKERNAVVADLNKQQHLYDVASEKLNTAVDNHVLALGALAVATQKRVEAKELLDLATYEHGVALAIWQAALDDLNEKEHTLATEKARIESEELDLERIMELLNQL